MGVMHRFSILVFSIIFPILRAMSSFSTILVTILVPIVIVLLSPVPGNGLSLVKPPLNYLILYKKTLRFHILLQKKLRKEFLTFEKKFRIVLITSYISLFIHFLIIIIGVVIITAFINKKLVTLFIYTSTKL